MSHESIDRRTILIGAGVAALAATGVIRVPESRAQEAVPNSSGTEAPKLKAPANSCDCHIHIYDPRFPPGGPTARLMTNARVAEYRLHQKRIGTTRTVVVTPSAYATGNDVTLDAIAELGLNVARGVVVVHPTITEADLKRMHDGGIRGIRFTLFDPKTAVTTIDMIEPLSKRVNDLGWHVQIHMRADQIVDAADLLQRLPSPLVFDHMGRLPQPAGTEHPALQVLRRLLDKGRTWIKLSGVYQDSKVGPPTYADATKVAQAYVKAAPQRMVWGSDWPHPTEKEKPNDAVLFDLLTEWAPDEATRRRILVENPEVLYDFAKS
jgi:predicted TIM-barrel fold metal-dependent hydrolase